MSPHVSTPGTGDARRVVVGASLVFAVLLVAGGALILWVRGRDILSPFDPGDWSRRVAIGAAMGALAAVACALTVGTLPMLARLRRLAEQAVDGIEPRWHTVLIISLSAGISEEFFFRGVIEPVIGPWLTSIGFMALHGALRFRDPGVAAFAVFLFAASTGLSAINSWQGLEAAMAAHAAYDLLMFGWLARATGRRRHSD